MTNKTQSEKEQLYHLKMIKKLFTITLKRMQITSAGWEAKFSGGLLYIEYESPTYFVSFREVSPESGDMFGRKTEIFRSPDIFKLLTFIAISRAAYGGHFLKEYILRPNLLAPLQNKATTEKKV